MGKIFLIIFLFSSISAFSQDSVKYHIALQSTGLVNKTQSKSLFLLNNGFNADVRNLSYRIDLSATDLYGKLNGSITNKDLNIGLNLDWFKDPIFPHTFYWALLNYTSSYSLKIRDERQIGFGLAYLFSNHYGKLALSDGIIYDESTITLIGFEKYQTYRNSFRLKFNYLFGNFILTGTTFLQNSLHNKTDYIIRSNNFVGVKVSKWLNLGTNLSYNVFNLTHRENFLFTYGLNIEKSVK